MLSTVTVTVTKPEFQKLVLYQKFINFDCLFKNALIWYYIRDVQEEVYYSYEMYMTIVMYKQDSAL